MSVSRYPTPEQEADVEQKMMQAAKSIAWIAEVFPDWTTLRIFATGEAFAFNRETGRVYKIPHPDCPFAQQPAADFDTWQQPAAVDEADDSLTAAYMAGRHDGRKEAQQPAAEAQPAAHLIHLARRVVSWLDHCAFDTSFLPDDDGESMATDLRALREAAWEVHPPPSTPVGVEVAAHIRELEGMRHCVAHNAEMDAAMGAAIAALAQQPAAVDEEGTVVMRKSTLQYCIRELNDARNGFNTKLLAGIVHHVLTKVLAGKQEDINDD